MKPRTPRLRNDASAMPFRRNDDRGAAFIEFLFAIPFLMIMVFGIVETGLAWRAVVQVHSAVRAGARVGSKDGNQPSADFDTLAAISAALPSDLKDSSSGLVIVIFKARLGHRHGAAGLHHRDGIARREQLRHPVQHLHLHRPGAGSTHFGCVSGAIDKQVVPDQPQRRPRPPTTWTTSASTSRTSTSNQTHTYFGDFTINRQVVFRLEPALP